VLLRSNEVMMTVTKDILMAQGSNVLYLSLQSKWEFCRSFLDPCYFRDCNGDFIYYMKFYVDLIVYFPAI
jgi:hypothetical protein